jgi:hypothetical protein
VASRRIAGMPAHRPAIGAEGILIASFLAYPVPSRSRNRIPLSAVRVPADPEHKQTTRRARRRASGTDDQADKRPPGRLTFRAERAR